MSNEAMNYQPEPIKPVEEMTINAVAREELTKSIIIPEAPSAIVKPAVSSQEALEAWNDYLDLKKKIVEENDIQEIQGKIFLKKSYWRKIATFFNLTVDLVSESHEVINGELVWNFACKATAPNGRSAIGTGSCSAYEKATYIDGKPCQKKVTKWGERNGKKFPVEWEWEPAQPNSIHNVRTTAETRAWNRAVSNLVGGGEVSAEEVSQDHEYDYNPPRTQEPETKSKPVESHTPQPTDEDKATYQQRRAIFAIKNSLGMTDEQLKTKFGIDSTKNLTRQQASAIIKELNRMQGVK